MRFNHEKVADYLKDNKMNDSYLFAEAWKAWSEFHNPNYSKDLYNYRHFQIVPKYVMDFISKKKVVPYDPFK